MTSKTDVYWDEKGRRRTDAAHSHDNPSADPATVLAAKLSAMEARMAKVEGDAATLLATVNGFTIVQGSPEVQISGQGPKSIIVGIQPGNGGGGIGRSPKDIIIADSGTLNTYTIGATFVAPVT